ncbi:tellurium resistance protein TerC [Paraglaciecola aquimarina]|uniref:Tellurium resistance protein TerC n=1 Tax=Paraglaciecola algarum TaxID=3050085 RepID=A0ABS9DBD0_9ALTE|nr:PGPGW domain-containing protein [Paraglaciecola sp. G1-23]MCF2950234.1 tellurium resistance protein TerC [Paraglaciecola sp. G1-23]
MKKKIRITLGCICAGFGVVFFILPGSIFVLILGLVMLSYDFPKARHLLKVCQKSMSSSARKLDSFLLKRKLRQ